MDDFYWEEQYEPDAETQDIVRRYENMLQQKNAAFLEEEEFELIIEHYLRTNNLPKAGEAADYASRTYPLSNEIKLRHAHTLLVRGDAYKAMQLLQALEYVSINDPDVFFLKARAYIQLGNVKEAICYFDKAVREATDGALQYAYDAALELMDMQDYAAALRYLKQVQEKETEEVEILNDMAFCYERLDELEKSEEMYVRYLQEEPFNDNAWYNLGTVYGRQKKFEEAVNAFGFAITTNEDNGSAYFNLAMTYMHLQRYTEAANTFNEFLTKEPETPYTYCLLGECYEQLAQFDEALEVYRKALDVNADFGEAYFGITMVYVATDRLDEAMNTIIVALKKNPENADYWFEYGKILRGKGCAKEALIAFEKTVEYNPYDTEALANITELWEEMRNNKLT